MITIRNIDRFGKEIRERRKEKEGSELVYVSQNMPTESDKGQAYNLKVLSDASVSLLRHH